MSAQIVHREKVVHEPCYYLTHLGYAYCTSCRPTEKKTQRIDSEDWCFWGQCDGCGTNLSDNMEEIIARYTVEHTSARIF